MRIACPILALALASMPTAGAAAQPQANPGHRWSTYTNARFGTRLSYPADMFGWGIVPDNGDGISLRSSDGATLLIFGRWNTERVSPAAYVRQLAREPRYRRIVYRLVRPGLVIVSGTIGPRIYYERYAFEAGDGAIHAMVLEYRIADRARYDPIIARMSASLTWVLTSLR